MFYNVITIHRFEREMKKNTITDNEIQKILMSEL